VPQGLRDLLEAQLGRLGATEQQVLEVGSVAGAEFAVASVAAGLQTTPEAVEAACEALARQG
jgi:predicted ATPase